MNRKQIASTIAYTLDWQGFTLQQRLAVAEGFANDMHLKGAARKAFLMDCYKASELEYIANAAIPGFDFDLITGEYTESEAAR